MTAAVAGDHLSRSRYVISDTGSQARGAVLIASQAATYDPADTAKLVYEAEALTALDDAAGTAVSGAHGGTAVVHQGVGAEWTPILSTEHTADGHLTHWGNYRLYARCYATDDDCYVRFEYSTGDAVARTVNSSVTIPGNGEFYLANLGEVRLRRSSVGTHQWQGALFAQSVGGTVETVGVDKLYFAPTESITIAMARQQSDADSSFIEVAARDTFSQTSGALNGKTADKGGTWSTSGGDATDFQVSGSGACTRTEVSDSSSGGGTRITNGRWALLGSSSLTDVSVSVELSQSIVAASARGLLARWVDSSNFLYLYYDEFATALYLYKRISGTDTLITASYPAAPAKLTLRVVGNTVTALRDGSTEFTASDSDLSSGGTLESGSVGIIDYYASATTNTRTYDNFSVATIDSDGACLADGDLYVRWDGAWRETEDSGIYAPAHVEGNLPRAPVSGLDSRTVRTLVLPTTGDFDTLPDTDPESFTVASYHRPAFLQLPE